MCCCFAGVGLFFFLTVKGLVETHSMDSSMNTSLGFCCWVFSYACVYLNADGLERIHLSATPVALHGAKVWSTKFLVCAIGYRRIYDICR